MGNLKTELSWPEGWEEYFSDIVKDVFASTARLRTVVPPGPVVNESGPILVPRIETTTDKVTGQNTRKVDTDRTEPPVAMRATFELSNDQIQNKSAVELLVRDAAARLAQAEDNVTVKGGKAKPELDRIGVDSGTTLEGKAGLATSANTIGVGNSGDSNEVTPVGVAVAGITNLQESGHYGTYGEIMSMNQWKQAVANIDGGSSSLRRIEALLMSDKIKPTPFLPQGITLPPPKESGETGPDNATPHAVVLYLGSPGYDLVWQKEPTLAFSGFISGGVKLELEERFLLRVIDSTAAALVAGYLPEKKQAGSDNETTQQA